MFINSPLQKEQQVVLCHQVLCHQLCADTVTIDVPIYSDIFCAFCEN